MRPVIHWFRRDLRLQDNTALHHALESGTPILPVFILDDNLLQGQYVGAARVKFMLAALKSLDESLRQYGARLIIRHGNPLVELQQLTATTNASALYFNADYSPYARKRDTKIEETLTIPVHSYDDLLLLPPPSILTNAGNAYKVYTPFWKKWKTQQKPPILQSDFKRDSFFNDIESGTIPALADLGLQTTIEIPAASETKAQQLLEQFMQGAIQHYDEWRNRLVINPFADDTQGTSHLSPYLRWGLLSPRQAYWVARDAYRQLGQAVETWISELAWREFYMHVLYHFPHVTKRDFVDTYQELAWHNDANDLQAWQDGQTGFPIVDAPMRQLQAIGWMPNRARMIVASFLTKDLLIHWKHGERHFMRYLLDGDVAANNGGWQWAAGTGTDAQPYFRIFNPVSQSKKFATPEYLRYWVPELHDVPDKYIHEPHKSGLMLDYPEPIINHAFARERTLDAFKAARGD